MKKQQFTEDRIQQDCFMWFWNTYPHMRGLLYKVHNEGKKGRNRAVKDKRMGIVSGIPDLCLAHPRGSFHGFYIELKRPGRGLSPAQKKRIPQIKSQGYKVAVVDSLEGFQAQIKEYMALETILGQNGEEEGNNAEGQG